MISPVIQLEHSSYKVKSNCSFIFQAQYSMQWWRYWSSRLCPEPIPIIPAADVEHYIAHNHYYPIPVLVWPVQSYAAWESSWKVASKFFN